MKYNIILRIGVIRMRIIIFSLIVFDRILQQCSINMNPKISIINPAKSFGK
jgi:hypothetical protein